MNADDAGWAAGLMERRRQVYAGYSPVFWRPRSGAAGLHARFLGRQLAAPGYVALRTEHGFLIGQRRDQEGFVDDFAVDEPDRWADDGAALLRAAWRRWEPDGVGAVRVVTAHADEDKCAMLAALSLDLAEQWWVRALEPATDTSPSATTGPPAALSPPASPDLPAPAGAVSGTGFAGRLVPAPPVYDPGGPVLDVSDLADDADLARVEREAAGLGAVLLVLPAAPGSRRSDRVANRPGWTVASDWYLGRPR